MGISAALTSSRARAAVLVATTAVSGVGLLLAPAAQAAGTATFSKSFTDTCAVPPFGSQDLPATVSGTVPTSVTHGTSFTVSGAKVGVSVPQSLNQAAYFAGARSGQVTFTVVNVNSSNTVRLVTNATRTAVTTARIPIQPTGTTDFVAPSSGGLSVPFTALSTSAGKKIALKVGSVKASLTLYDGNGNALISNQAVQCATPSTPVVLTSIPVR